MFLEGPPPTRSKICKDNSFVHLHEKFWSYFVRSLHQSSWDLNTNKMWLIEVAKLSISDEEVGFQSPALFTQQ